MTRELQIYDPNGQPQSEQLDEEHPVEQIHYHYYDQRTFVPERTPKKSIIDILEDDQFWINRHLRLLLCGAVVLPIAMVLLGSHPQSCSGHWSYAPSLGQAMDVSVSQPDGWGGYNVSIQKVDLNAARSGFIDVDNISMTENTMAVMGILIDATMHDNSGRGITLQCRTGGGRLNYDGREIALRQTDTDLKGTVAAKGWRWPQAATAYQH